MYLAIHLRPDLLYFAAGVPRLLLHMCFCYASSTIPEISPKSFFGVPLRCSYFTSVDASYVCHVEDRKLLHISRFTRCFFAALSEQRVATQSFTKAENNKKEIASRHLWDLRWHEENRAIAQGVSDLHQHHCLICRRGLGTQAHILCKCPALAQYASATTSTSTGPSVAYNRARSVHWAKQSHTYSTSTSLSKNGANSGRGSGPQRTDTSSKESSRDVPSEPVDGS